MNILKSLILVGAGGFLGSALRYGVSLLYQRFENLPIPLATLTVNLIGSILIGVFMGLAMKESISKSWHLFLVTGICGGFTTFSTFSYENVTLLKDGNYTAFLIYTGLSLALCILGAFIGISISK